MRARTSITARVVVPIHHRRKLLQRSGHFRETVYLTFGFRSCARARVYVRVDASICFFAVQPLHSVDWRAYLDRWYGKLR